MPYLSIDTEKLGAAWDEARATVLPATDLSRDEQRDFGRRAAVVHVPQSWPHGSYCHNCGHSYPCRLAKWGMRMLQDQGWELADLVKLIEGVQAGEPL